MSKANVDLRVALEELGAGELAIKDARRLVAPVLEAGGDIFAAFYNAFRSITWRMVRSPSPSEDIAQWYDLCTHVGAAMRRRNDVENSARMETLAELLGQTSRFAKLQSVDSVVRRQHTDAILAVLVKHKGRADKATIMQITGLRQANLSRLLNVLSVKGLIERSRLGKEAIITLTDSGRRVAGKQLATIDADDALPALAKSFKMPAIWWDVEGRPKGTTSDFLRLIRSAGFKQAGTPTRQVWSDWIANGLVESAVGDQLNGRIVRLTNDVCVKYLDAQLPDGRSLAVLADVSREFSIIDRLREEALSSKEERAGLISEVKRLERELVASKLLAGQAEARASEDQRRLLSARKAVEALSQEIIPNTAHVKSTLHSLRLEAELTHWHTQFDAMRSQISAVQTALRYFLVVPSGEVDRLPDARLWQSRNLLEETVSAVNALTTKTDFSIIDWPDMLGECALDASAWAVLGNALLMQARGATINHLVIHPMVRDNSLIILIGRKSQVRQPRFFGEHALADAKFDLRYSYLRDLARYTSVEVHANYRGETMSDALELHFPFVEGTGNCVTGFEA